MSLNVTITFNEMSYLNRPNNTESIMNNKTKNLTETIMGLK